MNDHTLSDRFNKEKLINTATAGNPLITRPDANLNYRDERPEILVITSYPPRVCGIATFSQDLIKALNNKFSNSLSVKVCALETEDSGFFYPKEVRYILNTSLSDGYEALAEKINNDFRIKIVLIQHEFGFYRLQEGQFLKLLYELSKPVVISFHTVLPKPDKKLKSKICNIVNACESVIVMTHNSAEILTNEYGIPRQKISVIAHGTHLVPHINSDLLKRKYGLSGRKVLTTFGLLSSGKSIETTLKALPEIIKANPMVLFLIIGKTHPEVVKNEGEKYRKSLESRIKRYKLADHVRFINRYVPLNDLLEFLQLTDIYLFTTKDPNQAVSGTFVYAMSCGCPIISTPIPHAKEVLNEETGIIIDFHNSRQLTNAVIRLINDDSLRRNMSSNTLQKIVSTVWENSAVSHAMLIQKLAGNKIEIQYNLPPINLNHLKQMTTETGLIQFSRINQPDITSGYTLDDNARALVATCMYFELTQNEKIIKYSRTYLNFIRLCLQPSGDFLNYVDQDNKFPDNNLTANLEDANGRAIWALGYLVSKKDILPSDITGDAESIIKRVLPHIEKIHSTRAIAFAIKGLYFCQKNNEIPDNQALVKILADRLVQMYRHESDGAWQWFEGYLTYANSVLPEAMLCAWLSTGDTIYKEIAVSSFNFLLSQIFNENGIEVISNKNWLIRGEEPGHFGEQPIDVAYTIMALARFSEQFPDNGFQNKMATAFNWFLGSNRLHQIIYNPCTGGCYDGLEDINVNINQGAESLVSYLMARLTVEQHMKLEKILNTRFMIKYEKRSRKVQILSQMLTMDITSTLPDRYFISDSYGIVKKRTMQIKTNGHTYN